MSLSSTRFPFPSLGIAKVLFIVEVIAKTYISKL
jgi:hypothetical protein